MADYFDIIFYSLVGGVFSLVGGILLLSRQKTAELLAQYATPFAAGALLAAVFLDLLKEGIEQGDPSYVMLSAMIGIFIFFFAERFLRWFHHHHQHEDEEKDPTIPLIIAGDTIHNAMDGVVIASAFLINVPTGIVTTLAVAAHEIPQEIGDFGLMLSKGMKRMNVLLVNVVSALATTIMAIITFAIGTKDRLPVGVLLGLSAGFLLYIAMSDIIPTIHQTSSNKKFLQLQSVLLALGALIVAIAIQVSHKYISE